MIYNNEQGELPWPPQEGNLLTWAKGKELAPTLADLPLEQGRLRFYYLGSHLDQAVVEYDLGDEVAYLQLQVKQLQVIEKPQGWESIQGGGITQEPLPGEPLKPSGRTTAKVQSKRKGAVKSGGRWKATAWFDGANVYLGLYNKEEEALKAINDFWDLHT